MTASSQTLTEIAAIEEFFRFRTCPACQAGLMSWLIIADAMRCAEVDCGFTLSGKDIRSGAAAVQDALGAHRERCQGKPADADHVADAGKMVDKRVYEYEDHRRNHTALTVLPALIRVHGDTHDIAVKAYDIAEAMLEEDFVRATRRRLADKEAEQA